MSFILSFACRGLMSWGKFICMDIFWHCAPWTWNNKIPVRFFSPYEKLFKIQFRSSLSSQMKSFDLLAKLNAGIFSKHDFCGKKLREENFKLNFTYILLKWNLSKENFSSKIHQLWRAERKVSHEMLENSTHM